MLKIYINNITSIFYNDSIENQTSEIEQQKYIFSNTSYYIMMGMILLLCCYKNIIVHFNICSKIKKICNENSLTESLYNDITDSECSICLETFTYNTKVCNLQCGHIYHKSCIKEWFKINSTCPQCRVEI